MPEESDDINGIPAELLLDVVRALVPLYERIDVKLKSLVDVQGLILQRLDSVDVRLDRIDGRLDRIETRLDRIETWRDKAQASIDDLLKRVAALEAA